MTDLPPDARRVLDAAQGADDPMPVDRARVRHALTVALAASAVSTVTSSAKAAASSAATTGSSVAVTIKVIGVTLALSAAGSLAWWQLGAETSETEHAGMSGVNETDLRAAEGSTLSADAEHALGEQALGEGSAAAPGGELGPSGRGNESSEPGEALGTERPAGDESAATKELAATKEPAATKKPAATKAPIASPPGTRRSRAAALRQGRAGASSSHGSPAEPQPRRHARKAPPQTQSEVALIERASHALSQGDPSRALDLLKTHASHYPSGVLAHERGALQVIALCALGGEKADRASKRFLQRSPNSPLAARVRAACGRSKTD